MTHRPAANTIEGMLKRLPPDRARELVADAALLPASNPRVSYPSWYLHRWHFLPEGYLSRRSAAWYEHIIRNVYNQGLESRTIAAVVGAVAALRPRSVLEVGSGPGRLLEALAYDRVGEDLVGVDLSPYLLERARRRLGGYPVRLVHADGLALPADEGAFDVAVASHYVGHLPAPLRREAVLELARVVRPGGHVVIVDHRWHPSPRLEELRETSRETQAPGFVAMSVFERVERAEGHP